MNIYFAFVLTALGSYFIGGLNSAIILSRLLHHEDIREKGSGNPGFTNYKRVYGKLGEALIVFFFDILKTVLSVALAKFLIGPYYGETMLFTLISGLFTALGHAYPIYYGFKGGKAFLSGITTVFFTNWKVGLIVTIFFLIVLFTTHYMSLSSILALFSFPFVLALVASPGWMEVALSSTLAFLVIFRHKENIKRLIRKEEKKFYFFKKA